MIRNGINYLSGLTDPTQMSDDTVKHVLEMSGFQVSVREPSMQKTIIDEP